MSGLTDQYPDALTFTHQLVCHEEIIYSDPQAMSVALEWKSESYDLAARERLIEDYLPLVRKIARRFGYTREP